MDNTFEFELYTRLKVNDENPHNRLLAYSIKGLIHARVNLENGLNMYCMHIDNARNGIDANFWVFENELQLCGEKKLL